MGQQNKGEWNEELAEAFRLDSTPKEGIDACLDILNKCDELEKETTDDDS